MSDKTLRHVISLIAFLVAVLIYAAAYSAGRSGWWFTAIGLIAVYFIVYKLVEV